MNHAEESIERLLKGLRGAEPPVGMQRRILEAMEAHEDVRSRAAWGWRTAVALPVACLLLLGGWWIVTVTVRHPAPEQNNQRVIAATRPAPKPQEVPASQRRVHSGKRPLRGRVETASYPAPPLPLTEQERLLLRLAHRRDAENMAVLNREVQAAQMAKATAQFQQFFGMDAKVMRSQIE